jgi:hypothetical protein
LRKEGKNMFSLPIKQIHCLETINNMWFLGKREPVNAWKKADFDGFTEKDE